LPQQPAARNESGQSKNGVQLKGGLLSKGWLIAAVRASVRNIDGTFTAQQVADRLKSTIPSAKRNSIKAALERLLAGKVIERVERGYGRTETTYRNKEEK
jgi:hypothetical protein